MSKCNLHPRSYGADGHITSITSFSTDMLNLPTRHLWQTDVSLHPACLALSQDGVVVSLKDMSEKSHCYFTWLHNAV